MTPPQDQPEADESEPSLRTRITTAYKSNPAGAIGLTALVAFILLTIIVNLPGFQGLAYYFVFGTPMITQWILVGTGIIVLTRRWDTRKYTGLLYAVGVSVIVLGVMFGPAIGGVQASVELADRADANAEPIDNLPNTSTDNTRSLPRSVADNYADSSVQLPKYGLTESDITYQNGSYKYSYGIQPDNAVVTLLGNQRGALYVDMSVVDKDVEITNTTFKNGRGQSIFDSYRYKSVLANPLQHHKWATTFNTDPNDGEEYIAHSTIEYDINFALTPIPQFYAVPELGKVQVTHPDGEIKTLTPEEAASYEPLDGQNYYPYDLSVRKVKATQYSKGILNKWFVKEGVLSIADLPEEGNSWPLVVPTEANAPNPTYFIATEPTGSGNGVFEVWTLDGQTGEMSIKEYDSAQIGPQKAVNYVENAPQVNRLSNAQAVAPVPVVHNEQLYYQIKVTPKSDTGVIYTAFLNADTGEPTLVEGNAEIYRFLNEGEEATISGVNQSEGESSSAAGTSTMTVIVTNENGEITGTRNITVPKGGDVEINLPN